MENIKDTEKDLEIDIENIGTILKSSRLKSKKSMEEISSELCIRKIYLTALEEGDYETLPPIPYGIGYVRTYARFLGLNEERAVKLYKAASMANNQKEESPEEQPEANKSSNWHIIVGILALAAVYGGWSLYNANMDKKSADAVELKQEESFDKLQESDSRELIDVPGEKESVSMTPIEEDALNTVESAETMVTSMPETVAAEPEENKEQAVAEAADNKIVLEFNGESWVELKDKNKVYFQGVFHNGDKKETDYAENLFLSVGRPYNVKVTIKGVEKNILAKKRKMNIPLDSLD